MRWGDLRFLFLLFLIPLWLGFFIYIARRRRQALARFCDSRFVQKLIPLFSPLRRVFKQALWLMAVVFLVMGLVEPQWGYHFEEVVRKGVDIMLLVDISNSMMAEDIKPNRLERAKRKVYDLLKMAQGDRIGLVVFAGRAVLLCPLTLDYSAIHQFLDSLSPDLISIQGTDLNSAIQTALKGFKDPKTTKAMILFTDGEDDTTDLQALAQKLKEDKIPLYILGFGSPEGAPIPLARGEGGFKRDDAGNVVISKLNERALASFAVATGGEYVRSVTGDDDLNELYVKGLKGALTGQEIKASKKRVYETRFPWPLGLALLFLLAEMLLSENKRVEKRI